MAQTENGVGISFKLSDGTMVWARRDTYAELTEDINIILGEAGLEAIEGLLQKAYTPVEQTMTPAEVERELRPAAPAIEESEGTTQYDVCPKCGELKNRWVPPGVSKKTQKPYNGFYGCPTSRCPGR